MEMGDPSAVGGPDAVALLCGRSDLDAVTREALAQAGLAFYASADPDRVRETAAEPNVSLVVADAAHADVDLAPFLARIREPGAEPIPAVILLPEGGSAAALGSGGEHVLARPFRAATLAVICRSLASAGSVQAAGARPSERRAVRLREPTRFSARPLYGETAAWVRSALEEARGGGVPDPTPGRVLAERIHTSLLQSNLLLLRALEPYARFDLAHHCANVAVIAGKVSIGLGLPVEETQRAVLAGLLHDIGMTRVPERILLKEGSLTSLEREEMERHPEHGASILSDLGDEWAWLRRAVRQEHERLGGQGYPEGLRGEEIDPLARILGAADVFEALSQVRTHRSPFTLFEALEKVTSMREEYFDPEVVDALASEISVFPVDSYVQLDTGDIGRVVAANATNLMRPTVEVLWDADWEPLAEPRLLELAEHPDVSIRRPLHEAEVPIT